MQSRLESLGPKERAFADALLAVVAEHGQFTDDSGVWVGYEAAADNDDAAMGVTCANCVFSHADRCDIQPGEIEAGGKCRLAVIPDGMVTGQFRFNPNQPRHPKGSPQGGKWMGGPAATSNEPYLVDGEIVASPISTAMAREIRARAEQEEPAITARLAEIVGDPNPGGYEGPPKANGNGELYGFEFRLKGEKQIATKIERVVAEKAMTRVEAAEDVKDAVRYTVHFSEEEFGDRAQGALDALRAEPGVEKVVVKNTWPPEAGVAYKGVNAIVYRSDGVKYEVQFHTPESQAVKDRMHLLYEEQRVLPRDNPRWQELEEEMWSISSGQPVPRDAYRVFRVARRQTFRSLRLSRRVLHSSS